MIGFKQTFVALRECLRLKQTFLYLVFFFLMSVVVRMVDTKGPNASVFIGAMF